MKWDWLDQFGANFTSVFGHHWLFALGSNEVTDEHRTRAKVFQNFYVGQGRNFSRSTKQELTDMFSDLFMRSPAYQALIRRPK